MAFWKHIGQYKPFQSYLAMYFGTSEQGYQPRVNQRFILSDVYDFDALDVHVWALNDPSLLNQCHVYVLKAMCMYNKVAGLRFIVLL